MNTGHCSVVPVVAELEERIRRGEKIYLHWCALARSDLTCSHNYAYPLPLCGGDDVTDACSRGGVGRAGTIGACLLVYMFHISAENALKRVQLAYDTRGGSGRSDDSRFCAVHGPDGLCTLCCIIQGHSNTHSRIPCTLVPNVSQQLCSMFALGISPETDEQADFVREFQRALDDGTITRMAPTPSV